MALYSKLPDGSKVDNVIHDSLLEEGERKWENSEAQQNTINRAMRDLNIDYETAIKLFK